MNAVEGKAKSDVHLRRISRGGVDDEFLFVWVRVPWTRVIFGLVPPGCRLDRTKVSEGWLVAVARPFGLGGIAKIAQNNRGVLHQVVQLLDLVSLAPKELESAIGLRAPRFLINFCDTCQRKSILFTSKIFTYRVSQQGCGHHILRCSNHGRSEEDSQICSGQTHHWPTRCSSEEKPGNW